MPACLPACACSVKTTGSSAHEKDMEAFYKFQKEGE